MASLNKCFFIGNVTRDPELRRTPSGDAVVSFTLAVNENFTGKDGAKRERTDYIDFEAWDRQAEVIAQYAVKGRLLHVTGSHRTEKWEDKSTGENRYKVRYRVHDFQLLGGNGGNGGNGGDIEAKSNRVETSQTEDMVDDSDDEIPF